MNKPLVYKVEEETFSNGVFAYVIFKLLLVTLTLDNSKIVWEYS